MAGFLLFSYRSFLSLTHTHANTQYIFSPSKTKPNQEDVDTSYAHTDSGERNLLGALHYTTTHRVSREER